MGETVLYFGHCFRPYTAPWISLPQPCKALPLATTVTESSKSHSQFYQASCFSMVGIMIKTNKFHKLGSFPHFICFEVSSLIKRKTVEYYD